MTTLTVLNCARTGAALSLTGATAAATGDRWLNTGNEVLVVTNTDASAHTVGVTVAAAPDGKDVTERTVNVVNGTTQILGPFPVNVYNDSGGYATIVYSSVTGMKVQAVYIPRS